VETGIYDYILLMDGNKSLLAEHDELCYCCEDLSAELAEARSEAEKKTVTLELKIKSAEARSVDVAAAGVKQLRDFEDKLARDLEELHELYVCNVQTIGGLSLEMPTGEPKVEYCLHWLFTEISGLLDMFSSMNENFATAAIEGVLVMARSSVDLNALCGVAAQEWCGCFGC
jgi:hypothetical protein